MKASRLSSLVLTFLILSNVRPAEAIVGTSSDGSVLASHLVMILNRSGTTSGFCTGIVIAPTVVMTAAHCAPEGAEIRIYPNTSPEPVMLPVMTVLRHPEYRADAIAARRRSIDLALIRLPASLPERFSPARLSSGQGVEPGMLFAIAGFGVTREGDGRTSGHLRSATLQAREPRSSMLLWAGDPMKAGTGACMGDSGAPVTVQDGQEVTALVVWSAGTKGHQCGDLTQALWLAPHRAWIDRILQGWGEPKLR